LAGLAFASGVLAGAALPAAPAKLALAHQRLELPGVPVKTLSVDLDRDGRRDLAVVVASTSWGELGFEEPMRADEGGGFVDVLTVVPAVLDRRELLVFLGGGEPKAPFGAAVRLELPPTVHALEAGPRSAPLVAWTDEGISEIVLAAREGEAERPLETSPSYSAAAPARELTLVPRISRRTLFSGGSSFLPKSGLVADYDGDGEVDLLLPVGSGFELYLSTAEGLGASGIELAGRPPAEPLGPEKAKRGPVPAERADPVAQFGRGSRGAGARRELTLPEVADLTGDRIPDLLFRDGEAWRSGVRLRLGQGGGRFGPPVDPLPASAAEAEGAGDGKNERSTEVVWLGDLDGDGAAELVTAQEIPNQKDSMRAEMAEAKRPRSRIRVHALDGNGRVAPASRSELTIEGYLFDLADGDGGDGDDDGDGESRGFALAFPAGVRDLDGDRRLDFVALTLDFSLFEAMRVLATQSIRLGLDFAIYRQGENLAFRPVPGLDLAGELRVRLDRASLGQISSFAGDFDGDGRADFVQLGRGRKVTIHRGQEGARYAPEPDLVVTLEREPLDVALVAVTDLDGDGRSDLSVTQPVGGKQIGARAALDLYLSAGAAKP
jgi:hypothetical protein